MVLGVMDGLPGLETLLREEFPKAKVQRCQVHVVRNVLAKVPKKLKKVVADDMRSILYASSKEKALEFFDIFTDRWRQDLPSAVRCLDNAIEACLTFFICPEEEWISLRTTNIMNVLTRNLISLRLTKRRTKPMEIVAGENACYTLLAFICLKMELHWKSNPIGKARNNLLFFKELEDKTFTQ